MDKLTYADAKTLLEPIPEDKWIPNEFTDKGKGGDGTKGCVWGHLLGLVSGNTKPLSTWDLHYEDPTIKLVQNFIREQDYKIVEVNNDPSDEYPQPTCKARVMAFIDDQLK